MGRNFNPKRFEVAAFDVVKEIGDTPLAVVQKVCEETGAEADLERGIVKFARVIIDA